MRAAYRLMGLAKQYVPDAVEAACAEALDVDVMPLNIHRLACPNNRGHKTTIDPANRPVMTLTCMFYYSRSTPP